MNKILSSLAVALGLIMSTPLAVHAVDAELVVVFQKQKDPSRIKGEADRVADFLSKKLGMKVKAQVPSDYAASVQALVSKKADIAYFDSMAFLLARRDGNASMLLAEERPDSSGKLRTEYDSIFVVAADSELKSFEDMKRTAKDIRFVFTSPTSTSGYIMPYRRFVKEGMLEEKGDVASVFKSVGFGGSYTQALEQVLAGRADVAAVSYYTLEGPSADKYLPNDKRSKLRVLDRTPGVPTHVIAARGGIDDALKMRIKDALIALGNEQPELLSDVYGTSRFTEANPNAHVASAIEAVRFTGLPLKGIVRKDLAKSK